MKKSSTKTEKILFQVTRNQKLFLESSAEKLDMSMSAYLRYLINQQMKKFPVLMEEPKQTKKDQDEEITDAELDELFDEIYQKPNQ